MLCEFVMTVMVKNRFFLHILYILIVLFSVHPVTLAQEKTFTVVIDAGHGGTQDPGAVGPTVKEKDINLAVALKVGKLISDNNKNVKVVYTRKTDVFIGLDERAEIANKSKADLFISIHANSLDRKSKSYGKVVGAETYALGLARTQENLEVAMRENSVILLEEDYLQKYEGFDPNSSESYIIFEFMQNKHLEQSVSFASEIQKEFSAAGRADRGVRQAGFLVLRKTSMPSVLVEIGFITTRNEETFMKSAAGQDKLAKAIYNAFTKYKREYDKRLGTPVVGSAAEKTSEKASEKTSEKAVVQTTTNKASSVAKAPVDEIIYKVQVFTSTKKIPTSDKRFRGNAGVGYYVDRGIYKYTIGETTDKKEITALWNTLKKDFRDSFVIEFKDGKRIK